MNILPSSCSFDGHVDKLNRIVISSTRDTAFSLRFNFTMISIFQISRVLKIVSNLSKLIGGQRRRKRKRASINEDNNGFCDKLENFHFVIALEKKNYISDSW